MRKEQQQYHYGCSPKAKYIRLHGKNVYLNIPSDAGTVSLFIEYCPWCGGKL